MTKILGLSYYNGGKHCIDSQVVHYAFNSTMLLQHIFPRTNLKLQLKVVVKWESTTLGAPWTFTLIKLFSSWKWQMFSIWCQEGSYFKNFIQ
jgi:hypothetical protein